MPPAGDGSRAPLSAPWSHQRHGPRGGASTRWYSMQAIPVEPNKSAASSGAPMPWPLRFTYHSAANL